MLDILGLCGQLKFCKIYRSENSRDKDYAIASYEHESMATAAVT